MLNSARQVTSWVPQGSMPGPQLFLLFMNHVVTGSSCTVEIFIDDIKLYLAHEKNLASVDDVFIFLRNLDLLVPT